jgi:Glycoside-hydrolase family GH114
MRVAVLAIGTAIVAAPQPPPADARFDYQIGGDYEPPAGVTVVSRDWFAGEPLDDAAGYSICYVNAFQTQPDEADVARSDERSQWPPELVLSDLGDDPNWEGEYLIDLSTAAKRAAAAEHVAPMIDTCAAKGFHAVELDNLDSWTRL